MVQNERRVYYQEIVNGEILFKTDTNALLHILVILVAVSILPITALLKVEGSNDLIVWVINGICLLAILGLIFVPVQEKYTINLNQRNLQFIKSFITTKLGFPKEQVTNYSILLDGISFGESKFRNKGILIKTADGDLLLVVKYPKYDLGAMQHEVEKYFGLAVDPEPEPANPLVSAAGIESGSVAAASERTPEEIAELQHLVIKNKMYDQIRSWGNSSLLLAVLHFVASGTLSPSWGVILLVVGLGSFVFKSSAMFILYALALFWVGVNNMVSADIGGWTLFGLYQIYLAYRVYRNYKVFHNNESLLNSDKGKDEQYQRSETWFPILGLLIGGGALVLFMAIIVYVFYAVAVNINLDAYGRALDIALSVLSGLGVIGLSVSLASILSKYKRRWLAWIGLVLSILLMGIDFYLMLG